MLMFSVEKHLKGVSLAISAAALAISAPLVAGVIVKSSGPSAEDFPVGTKVKDTDRIVLEEGDQVTILNSAGTRELRGPGTFRAGVRGAPQRATLANLTRQGARQRVRPGATRAGSGEGTRSPNLWYVDVTKSGSMCVPDLQTVFLWRPETETEQTFIMRPGTSDYHQHVTFAEGSTVRPVDNERLPLEEGVEYMISGPGGAVATTVTFTVIDAPTEDAEGMADILIDKGCSLQLDLLSQTLATN